MSHLVTPLFSIVIPAYNDLQLFQEALDSVLQQQGVDVEIIVADDTESTIIEEYVMTVAERSPLAIRYSHSTKQRGAVYNWNRGLALAKGRLLLLLHHDERLQNHDFLLQMAKALESSDVAVADVVVSAHDRAPYRLAPRWAKRWFVGHPSLLFLANLIGPCACLGFRRDALVQFDEGLHWLVDVEWYYRLLIRHSATFLPQLNILSRHGHRGQLTEEMDVESENCRDLAVLRKRYHSNLQVRLCLYAYQQVLHNKRLNALIKRIISR